LFPSTVSRRRSYRLDALEGPEFDTSVRLQLTHGHGFMKHVYLEQQKLEPHMGIWCIKIAPSGFKNDTKGIWLLNTLTATLCDYTHASPFRHLMSRATFDFGVASHSLHRLAPHNVGSALLHFHYRSLYRALTSSPPACSQ
jgi:hypothetical protein